MSNRQRSIARRWFSEWTPDPPVYGRTTEWLMNLVEYKPERAWDFILTLVDNAPNEDRPGLGGRRSARRPSLRAWPDLHRSGRGHCHKQRTVQGVFAEGLGENRMDPSTYGRLRRVAGVHDSD